MCLFDRSSSPYARHLCAVVNGIHYLKYVMILILVLDFGLVLLGGLAAYYEKVIQDQQVGPIRLIDEEQAYPSEKEQPDDEQQHMALFQAQALA